VTEAEVSRGLDSFATEAEAAPRVCGLIPVLALSATLSHEQARGG
jgi:hypothetical protein